MTLTLFLNAHKDVRKLFGKRELEIMNKQVGGVSLTQSEKNRLSRDIRPKLRCMLEIAAFGSECTLERNQENKRMIQKAITTVLNDKEKENIKAILLFGSHVENRATQRSDIDIAVLFKNSLSLSEATAFRIRILGELPEKVDLQVFEHLPQKIKRAIARTHHVLYKAKEFDNILFTTQYMKEYPYFLRMEHILGVPA